MNIEAILRGIGNNILPILKVFSFSVFFTSIIVFSFSEELDETFGPWPHDLEQSSILLFLITAFNLIFMYAGSAIKAASTVIREHSRTRAVANISQLEETILFTMSLDPARPLNIKDFCKHEAPRSCTHAEVYAAFSKMNELDLIKLPPSQKTYANLTDRGLKKALEVQKRRL